jgi:predicted Zn finger-like uncharacterized protein
VIVTCPGCKTRYRVDAGALTRPGGRTVRCATCRHSWHLPPAALDPGPGDPAKADLPPLEPMLAAPRRRQPVIPAPPPPPMPSVDGLPGRRRWLTLGLPMLLVLIVVLAALYLSR